MSERLLLVFGRTGQVGRELARLAPDAVCLGRAEADFAAAPDFGAILDRHRPRAVINAAAYTAVDRAEEEESLAMRVNGEAVVRLAEAAAARGLPLVHVSTDYVFDGSGSRPWRPEDPPAPRSAYGRSKLAGEEGVRAAAGPHTVVRTSWVFSAHGRNFVRTMLRLGAERPVVQVVADQVGGPTPAAALAGALVCIADALIRDPGCSGTYHYAGAPDVSWAAFARRIFQVAGLETRVEEVSTEAFGAPAPRPKNSRLDCTATEAAFGLARPDWEEGLRMVLEELGAANMLRSSGGAGTVPGTGERSAI